MNAASGEARKSAGPARSIGVPIRPTGIWDSAVSRRRGCSVVVLVSFVSTNPGARPFTRMPAGAQAWPSVRVNAIAPAFDAEYAGLPLLALIADIELMMMIDPAVACRGARNLRQQCMRLSKLTETTRLQPSRSNSAR